MIAQVNLFKDSENRSKLENAELESKINRLKEHVSERQSSIEDFKIRELEFKEMKTGLENQIYAGKETVKTNEIEILNLKAKIDQMDREEELMQEKIEEGVRLAEDHQKLKERQV